MKQQSGVPYDAKSVQYRALYPETEVEKGDIVAGLLFLLFAILFIVAVKVFAEDRK